MLNLPENRANVCARILQDIKSKLPQSNPFLKRGILPGLAWGLSGRTYDLYLRLKKIWQNAFLQTADPEHLEKFGYMKSLPQKAGAYAFGMVRILGVPSSEVPSGIVLQHACGVLYKTEGAGFVSDDGGFVTRAVALSLGRPGNLNAGESLKLVTPLPGLEEEAIAQTVFSGGADAETPEEYRSRLKTAYSQVYGNFSASSVDTLARKVDGVTRVWVYRCQPKPGHCRVYFVLDNNPSVLPQEEDLRRVKKELLAYLPVDMLEENVHVLAPVAKEVRLQITGLTPDLPTLRQAVTENLKDLFLQVDLGQSIKHEQLDAVIFNTLDTETGLKVSSFSMQGGDISAGTDELLILAGVTYA